MPNLLYVAATRASQELILIEHIDTHQPLPFLHLTHSQMAATNYIKVIRHPYLDNAKYLDKIGALIERPGQMDKPEEKTVSDLIKFIDERTLGILAGMLEQVYSSQQTVAGDNNIAEIPSDIKTGLQTYEQVSDINGITIPALLFCSKDPASGTPESLKTSRDNYLWNYIRTRFLTQTTDDVRHSFIKSYIHKIQVGGLAPAAINNWLLLGNIFACANEGYNYKLKQITEYDWLAPEMIAICHRNIETYIPPSVAEQSIFELELGTSTDSITESISYKFQHDIYGWIKLRGRVDCITPDTVWEFKCVESITLEHMIQLAIYAWIWKRQIREPDAIREKIIIKIFEKIEQGEIPGLDSDELDSLVNKKLKQYYNVFDTYLKYTHNTTREELFRAKHFKLLNIRTGEVRVLNTEHHLLDEIMETILAAKMRIKKITTNEEFIDEAHKRIRNYIPAEHHYKTHTELEAEEDANRPELDF